MANLILNAGFLTDLGSWTAFQTNWDAAGAVTPGSAKLMTNTAYITQSFTVPAGDDRDLVISWWARISGAAPGNAYHMAKLDDGTAVERVVWISVMAPGPSMTGQWERYSGRFRALAGNTIALRFDNASVPTPNSYWYLDDIFVGEADDLTSCESLVLELAKRRRDPSFTKHPRWRYEELVNQAISETPRCLWRLEVDDSLLTVEETRRYSLAGLVDLERRDQVVRAWMEDTEGHFLELADWWAEETTAGVTLALDEDPPEADRTIRVEYLRPHAALDCTDESDLTTADRQWVLARAMVLLLLEADADIEPPQLLQAELQRWDQVRAGRETELRGRERRKATRARSHRWS